MLNQGRLRLAALAALIVAAAGFLTACAGGAPTVDRYTVRLEASGIYASAPRGYYRASEDVNEGYLDSDRVHFDRDMDLSGSAGAGGLVETRLGSDSEARLAFRQLSEFDGESRFDRPRRFDGRTYGPAENVHSSFRWNAASASYAHRVAVLGGDGAPQTDVFVRLGVERNQFHGALAEDRFILATAPFLGLDTRTRIADGTTLLLAADAGAWNHQGQQIQMADASIGLRQQLVGPLDVTVGYQISLRDATVRRSDLEQSQARFALHQLTLSLGLSF